MYSTPKFPMGMFTVALRSKEIVKIKQFCEKLQYFLIAVSWGGHESLIMPKCAFVAADDPQANLVRLYIGLEDADVLIADLEQALQIL